MQICSFTKRSWRQCSSLPFSSISLSSLSFLHLVRLFFQPPLGEVGYDAVYFIYVFTILSSCWWKRSCLRLHERHLSTEGRCRCCKGYAICVVGMYPQPYQPPRTSTTSRANKLLRCEPVWTTLFRIDQRWHDRLKPNRLNSIWHNICSKNILVENGDT